MKRLAQMTGISLEEMIFRRRPPDPEGNDYPVKVLGVLVRPWTAGRTVTYVTSLASLSPQTHRRWEDPSAQVSLGRSSRGEPCRTTSYSTPMPAPPKQQGACGAVC